MHGNLITTEAVFFYIKSGTVLFTDLIQQLPNNLISGWRAVVAKLDLMMEREPSCRESFVSPLPAGAPRARLWNTFSHGPLKRY